MALSDKSYTCTTYTTSYWSAIISIDLFCTIFELLDVEDCHDLQKSISQDHWK